MDDDDLRRMFADAEQSVRPAPAIDAIRRAARARHLRAVGLECLAVAAAASVAVAAVAGLRPAGPEPRPADPPLKLSCDGAIASGIIDHFSGKGYSTPRRAVVASVRMKADSSLEVILARDHTATGLIRRPDGSVQATAHVGRAAGRGDGWQVTSVSACSDFFLRPR